MASRRVRSGQAMIETVLALLVVSVLAFFFFRLAQLLEDKIFLQHAAMRVARARTIGMNEYMCRKAARIAAIPVCGRRLWPEEAGFDAEMERGRFANYLAARHDGVARGILEYERWKDLSVEPGDGTDVRVSLECRLLGDEEDDAGVCVRGSAGIERNATLYLNDQGL